MEVARANGWEAETERSGKTPTGEDWRADVLAWKDGRQVAIEIQWSPQTDEETHRRQERYAEFGIRGLWVFRQPDFPISHFLPGAQLGGGPEQGYLAVLPNGAGEQTVPINEFFAAALTKRLRFGVPLGVAASVSIQVGHLFCWACGAETPIVTFVRVAFGPNTYALTVPSLTDHPELMDVVRPHLPPGLVSAIKQRFSGTQQRTYLSNGCSHCGALMGEFYEHHAWEGQQTVSSFPIRMTKEWREAIRNTDPLEAGSWAVYPEALVTNDEIQALSALEI